MSWILFLQIALLMLWAAILVSPWTPRAQRRIHQEWMEVDRNDPRRTGR